MDTHSFKKNISTREASELSGYHADYLGRLCREGKVKAVRIGRAWLVDRDSLKAFMRSQNVKKQELSKALSRTREKEYMRARAGISGAAEHGIGDSGHYVPGPARTDNGEKTLAFFINIVQSRTLRRQSLATLVTIAALSAGAYAAYTGVTESIAEATFSVAINTHSFLLTEITQIQRTAYTRVSPVRTTRVASSFSATSIGAVNSERAQALLALVDKPAIKREQEHTLPSSPEVVPTHPEQHVGVRAYSHTYLAASVISGAKNISIRSNAQYVTSGVFKTYLSIGNAVVFTTNSILDRYTIATERAGTGVFSVGIVVRDFAYRAPEISSRILAVYEKGIIAWVTESPRIAAFITSSTLSLGDSIAQKTAYAITRIPASETYAMNSIVVAATNSAYTGTAVEIAIGNTLNDAVFNTLHTQIHVMDAVGTSVVETSVLAVTLPLPAIESTFAHMNTLAEYTQSSTAFVTQMAAPAASLSPAMAQNLPEIFRGAFSEIVYSLDIACTEIFDPFTNVYRMMHPSHPSSVRTDSLLTVATNASITVPRVDSTRASVPPVRVTVLSRDTRPSISNGFIEGALLTIDGSTTLGSTLSIGTTTVNNGLSVSGDLTQGVVVLNTFDAAKPSLHDAAGVSDVTIRTSTMGDRNAPLVHGSRYLGPFIGTDTTMESISLSVASSALATAGLMVRDDYVSDTTAIFKIATTRSQKIATGGSGVSHLHITITGGSDVGTTSSSKLIAAAVSAQHTPPGVFTAPHIHTPLLWVPQNVYIGSPEESNRVAFCPMIRLSPLGLIGPVSKLQAIRPHNTRVNLFAHERSPTMG